ncbi:MAG: hypothetical protein ACRD01_03085 [Terriglobales bacterium]
MTRWLAALIPFLIALAVFAWLWPMLRRAPFGAMQLVGLVIVGILIGIAWAAAQALWRRHHRP